MTRLKLWVLVHQALGTRSFKIHISSFKAFLRHVFLARATSLYKSLWRQSVNQLRSCHAKWQMSHALTTALLSHFQRGLPRYISHFGVSQLVSQCVNFSRLLIGRDVSFWQWFWRSQSEVACICTASAFHDMAKQHSKWVSTQATDEQEQNRNFGMSVNTAVVAMTFSNTMKLVQQDHSREQ